VTLAQPVKKFPAFRETWYFITVFTPARHWSLFCAILIQSAPPILLRSIYMSASHLCLGLPSGLFLSSLLVKMLYAVFPHSFLNSAVGGGEWLTSRPYRFTLRKQPLYTLDKRLGGPQSRCGRFRENKNLFPLLGFELRTVQSVA